MKHWKYLCYILRHKWSVFLTGLALGVPFWQLVLHDLSKFRPSEWGPYAEWFYGYQGGSWHNAPKEFVRGSKDDMFRQLNQEAFDQAWLLHQHRNPHHWQFWVLREDSGNVKVLEMPERYWREMVADWRGAGLAITGKDDTSAWYERTKTHRLLHPDTKYAVEKALGIVDV